MVNELLRFRDGLLGLIHSSEEADDRFYNFDDEGNSAYFFELSFDEEMSEWLVIVDACIADEDFVASTSDFSFDEGLEVVSRLLPGLVASGVFDDVTTEYGLNLTKRYGRELPEKFDRFKEYMLVNK